MKKLIMLISFALIGCGQAPKSERNGMIYTFGSSITAGLAHPNYAENIADSLNMNLNENAKGGTSMFDQNSVGDRTQYDLIMNYAWLPGSTIIWDVGINDAILHGDDPIYLAQFTDGLNQILDKFEQNDVTVYITTPIHNLDENRFVLNSITDQYATIARDLVAQRHNSRIKIIDFTVGFIPAWNSSLPYDQQYTTTTGNLLDGIHPNIYGYQQMCDYFLLNK